MNKLSKNQKIGILVVIVAFVFIILCAITAINYSRAISVDSFEKCAATGAPILETFPEQCIFNGKTYVRTLSDEEKKKVLPPISSPQTQFYGSSSESACNVDSDCIVTGCNSEICGSKADEAQMSICIAPDQPLPKDLGYSCGCKQQKCMWAK